MAELHEEEYVQRWEMKLSKATYRDEHCPQKGIFTIRFELKRTHRLEFIDPMDGTRIDIHEYPQPRRFHNFCLPLPVIERQQEIRTRLREFIVASGVHPNFHRGIIEQIISYALRADQPQQEGLDVYVMPRLKIVTTKFAIPLEADWNEYCYDFDEPVEAAAGTPALETTSVQHSRDLHSFLAGKDMDDSWDECNICLENLAKDGELTVLSKMPCSHVFHNSCILRWLHERSSCPLCRFVIT